MLATPLLPKLAMVTAVVTGLIVGYVNFRAAMTFFFIISNLDTPLILLPILGYAALLPLTIIGFFYPGRAAKVLLVVTAVAFVFGLAAAHNGRQAEVPSPFLHAAIHIGIHFVLPNVVVALLFGMYSKFQSGRLPSPSQ